MSKIRILPGDVANRIAAGEVIERPASVVKELVENAIDAGAGRIRIQTTQGGRRLIQVIDDGSGMDREDALLCIEAHATSKIRDSADVGQIRTLGFRGEALPSISAVSHFLLQTRRAEDDIGTEVLMEAGTLRDVRDCGCAVGTHIRVSHLFANMPARRKFMRGAHTEDAHNHETILLQALAHPEIAFEYLANGREALRAGVGKDARERIGMLMGRDVMNEMLPVAYEEAGFRVHGFVARPGFTRSNRREQRVFINGRPATAQVVFFGIKEAYHGLVMKGRFAPTVLFIEVAPERVDVNIHPAKREVRFREARLAGQVVTAAVSRALRGMVTLSGATEAEASGEPSAAEGRVVPAARPFRHSGGGLQPQLPIGDIPAAPAPVEDPPVPVAPSATPPGTSGVPPAPAPAVSLDRPRESDPGLSSPSASAGPAPPVPPPPMPPPVVSGGGAAGGLSGAGEHVAGTPRGEIASLRVLGSLSEQYIVAAGTRGLVLIDQVAAHQRVVFERMLRALDQGEALRQPLLMPATVDLGSDDARRLKEHLDDFGRLGFSIDPFGGNTFLVSAVPARFPAENVAALLRDILDDLRERGRVTPATSEIRLAEVACRHAVRPKDTLSDAEIRGLIEDLSKVEMPYTCPNGRPVMIHLPFSEINKRFGRKETGKDYPE